MLGGFGEVGFGELFDRGAFELAAFVGHDLVTADRLYREMADDHSCYYEANALHAEAPYWIARLAEARGDRATAVAEYDTLLTQGCGADILRVVRRDARARLAKLGAR